MVSFWRSNCRQQGDARVAMRQLMVALKGIAVRLDRPARRARVCSRVVDDAGRCRHSLFPAQESAVDDSTRRLTRLEQRDCWRDINSCRGDTSRGASGEIGVRKGSASDTLVVALDPGLEKISAIMHKAGQR
jgi:hypothetical protein